MIIDGVPTVFPYKEVINPVIINIFKIPDNQAMLTSYDPKMVVTKSVLKEHREISCRASVGPGKYVIVPSCSKPGEMGDYHLTIYVNKPIGHLDFERLDKPDDEYSVVMEESENVLDIPEWKEDLCQVRFKTMILGDDEKNSSINGASFDVSNSINNISRTNK